VTFTGFEPHDRSLRRVRSADLLFLPMHNLPPGRRATIVPGKTYEYMASGRPILAAVPDGDARDFLQQCGTAHLCRPDDVEGMLRILRGVHAAWKKKETPPKPDRAFLGGFERRAQTGALAREFSSLLAGAEASEAA
jgi:glycosyltransferase involved in cell wall biosynthesis